MKQAIAGVSPSGAGETTVMTVWPSNAATIAGQWLGKLFSIDIGFYIFTVGNVICLLAIPAAIVIYFLRLLPVVGRRYRVTNQRIVIQHGPLGSDGESIGLGDFDQVDVDTLPGQAWYQAGDLVFRRNDAEVFRLRGVSRPEAFRQVCLKSSTAYQSVAKVLEEQSQPA